MQAANGSAVYADSGSKVTSTVAAVDASTVACASCLFQGPGASGFTNLTSAVGQTSPSPITPSSPGSSSGGGSSLSGGVVGGIVAGALFGILVVALIVWLLLTRRKKVAGKDVELAKPTPSQVMSVENRMPRGAADSSHCCACYVWCKPHRVLSFKYRPRWQQCMQP